MLYSNCLIMGIPSYFSFIVKNHPRIITKFIRRAMVVNNLYLDCNSIIYDVVKKHDFSESANSDIAKHNISIITNVIYQIEEYINNINPTNNIYIAFDGVAPVAKLDQQRNRRYKSWYQNNVHKQIFKKAALDPFNTTSITPGTEFMNILNDRIYTHFSAINKRNKVDPLNTKRYIVSGSDCPSEGEHKLFQHIRENPSEHSTATTVIYGLDADLIMLSINHLPLCGKIYLFRETPEFIKSIDSSLEPNETYVLDIEMLSEMIKLNMVTNTDAPTSTTSTANINKNVVHDYIFICFFLGNDFMPHFPALNIRSGGVNKVLDAYKETMGKTNEVLTDGKTIYWNNVRKFVGYLKQKEEVYIQTEIKLRDRRSKNVPRDDTPENAFAKFESIPNYERDLEKSINPFRPFWQNRYYKSLLRMDPPDNERKKQISMNYLEGLEWNMKYYTSGCVDWRWSYKHHYPPLLEDLYNYIPLFETTLLPKQITNPVNPMVQLCYVIPLSSLNLLPANLHHKMMTECQKWYKSDCDFVWAFCRYFWEAHVDLPHINIKELEEFLTKNKMC